MRKSARSAVLVAALGLGAMMPAVANADAGVKAEEWRFATYNVEFLCDIDLAVTRTRYETDPPTGNCLYSNVAHYYYFWWKVP
ncbi:hypothetical protein [Nonomuraea guangzhouensis]|uniref:Endonuclease n=1 Tax=Nonomuraea guangzhouensis TaxID=1291555 RepID=A0ABW4GTN6_9ACTN|nr:hypothetical protein [Nonomuraea guangzhouensis]